MESAERRFNALDFLLDYSKGTLWWVNNRLWNKVIPHFVWKKKCTHHPGLSIAREKADGVYSAVPMLIGTSRKLSGNDVLVVTNINKEENSCINRLGYFSTLRSHCINIDEFGRSNIVIQNKAKTRLTQDEMMKLNELLKRREA